MEMFAWAASALAKLKQFWRATPQVPINVPIAVRSAALSAIITRADGTVEDLGVIATMEKPS